MKELHSIRNPTVKKMIGYLEKSRERKKDEVFVVEGLRENARAIAKGYGPVWLFFSEDLLSESHMRDLIGYREQEAIVHSCNASVFGKLAFRAEVANVVGLYRKQPLGLDDLLLGDRPLILVAEGVEKPGNLGAILRSANAAGVNAVLVADSVADIHHPHVMRNSLGGFFDTQVVTGSSQDIIAFLRDKQIGIAVTYLEGSVPHDETDLTGPIALVVGAEDRGVSRQWVDHADVLIRIPMVGVVDSLNVSVASAVVLFEADRQRRSE